MNNIELFKKMYEKAFPQEEVFHKILSEGYSECWVRKCTLNKIVFEMDYNGCRGFKQERSTKWFRTTEYGYPLMHGLKLCEEEDYTMVPYCRPTRKESTVYKK